MTTVAQYARQTALEIRAAMREHEVSYPGGDYASANRKLGALVGRSESIIRAAGLWPDGRIALGNEQRARLLDRIAEAS